MNDSPEGVCIAFVYSGVAHYHLGLPSLFCEIPISLRREIPDIKDFNAFSKKIPFKGFLKAKR